MANEDAINASTSFAEQMDHRAHDPGPGKRKIMEILGEILGWLLQFVGELLLDLGLELAAAALGHVLKEPWRHDRLVHPIIAVFGYFVYGGILGGLSLWAAPAHFLHAVWAPAMGLLLIPLISGGAMMLLGAWVRRRGELPHRLESFFYGFIFAFALALVRAIWAR